MIDTDVLFAVILMGGILWTFFYLAFAGHYFVATVIDSAAGLSEVNFPADNVIDRLWRVGLCLWIPIFWVLLGTILFAPILGVLPEVYFGVMPVLLWILFPVSLLSMLYTQNWVFMVHPKLVWQKLQHFGAMAYVHVVTLMLSAVGCVLVALVALHSFYWAMPAAFILPTVLLLYARHWGRFAWLALYSERPRKTKKKPNSPMDDKTLRAILEDHAIPEMEVEEFNPEVEGIRGGLPATFPSAVHAGVPVGPDGVMMAVPAVASETVAVEEVEEEFSKTKKPYPVIEPPSPGMAENLTISVADSKPGPLSEYYDEQYREEKARKKREAGRNRFLPPQDGAPPTFQTALLRDVWEWLFYPSTLHAWAILIALTVVELFFITMVVRNWPDNNGG